ncbi:hypothetical protein IG631_21622 [Alternaria alternata]|nr:hypothetical protein IG631_21622 [Alternaria alternata]
MLDPSTLPGALQGPPVSFRNGRRCDAAAKLGVCEIQHRTTAPATHATHFSQTTHANCTPPCPPSSPARPSAPPRVSSALRPLSDDGPAPPLRARDRPARMPSRQEQSATRSSTYDADTPAGTYETDS